QARSLCSRVRYPRPVTTAQQADSSWLTTSSERHSNRPALTLPPHNCDERRVTRSRASRRHTHQPRGGDTEPARLRLFPQAEKSPVRESLSHWQCCRGLSESVT